MKIKVNYYERILTEVYHQNEKETNECNINTIDDLKKSIPYMSEYRIIFKVNKVWIHVP